MPNEFEFNFFEEIDFPRDGRLDIEYIKKCKICRKQLTNIQRKFCSKKCREINKRINRELNKR